MLKFLFGTKPGAEPVKETARQTAERALTELNEILGQLPDQPSITVAPGKLDIAWPEQMPGEAKALPAPEPVEDTATEQTEAEKAA